jgi:hypothetical protein
MGWSSEEARSLQRPTTVMYANNNNDVSEVNESTGPATAVTVSKEVFLGIDTSKRKQVVTRLTPGWPVGSTPSSDLLSLILKSERDGTFGRNRFPALRRRAEHHSAGGSESRCSERLMSGV